MEIFDFTSRAVKRKRGVGGDCSELMEKKKTAKHRALLRTAGQEEIVPNQSSPSSFTDYTFPKFIKILIFFLLKCIINFKP